jgi:hypothetical protein
MKILPCGRTHTQRTGQAYISFADTATGRKSTAIPNLIPVILMKACPELVEGSGSMNTEQVVCRTAHPRMLNCAQHGK